MPTTVNVPTWWIVISGIYFLLSVIWSAAVIGGAIVVTKKLLPILTEAKTQVRRVSGQAKAVAAKASNTADIVHAQTQNLLGNANTTGNLVTAQARTVGAALTGVLVAARVIKFVRRII